MANLDFFLVDSNSFLYSQRQKKKKVKSIRLEIFLLHTVFILQFIKKEREREQSNN